jgi:hypothetical protein
LCRARAARNRATVGLCDKLGPAEYEAVEGSMRWDEKTKYLCAESGEW